MSQSSRVKPVLGDRLVVVDDNYAETGGISLTQGRRNDRLLLPILLVCPFAHPGLVRGCRCGSRDRTALRRGKRSGLGWMQSRVVLGDGWYVLWAAGCL